MPRPNKPEKIYMYGKNALMEALLSAPQVVKKVHLAADFHDAGVLKELEERKIPLAVLKPGEAKQAVGSDASHQGVIAVIDASKLMIPYGEFIASLSLENQPAVAVLGEVQDPHNVGAIIRSAAAFGLSAVLIPEHNQAQVTGTVIKTSAGMTFRIPLVSIGNVNDTLRDLKKRGFWIYGLAMGGATDLASEDFARPSAFVLGNEGAGLREKTLETCDFSLSIPMHARTESLNVAVSAGIVFSSWSRRHPDALS